MIVAWTNNEGKRFSLKEAENFFNLSKEEIKRHIEDGTSISKGIRYWQVDELIEYEEKEDEISTEEFVEQNFFGRS